MTRRVICVHSMNDYSGSPNVLLNVIHALNDARIEVDLYTNSFNSGFLNDAQAKKKRTYYKWSPHKFITLLNLGGSQLYLFFCIVFSYGFRKGKPIIYVNTLLPFGAALAGKLIGAKVIYHVHETFIRPKILKRFLKAVQYFTADLSLYVSDYLLNDCNNEKSKSRRVYNALAPSFFRKVSRVTSPLDQEGKFNVLMACSLKEYKGVYEFLNVAGLMTPHRHIHFTLILNVHRDDVDAFKLKNKIPGNVTILDAQASMHEYYQSSSLLLNLTITEQCLETFGLTILEAMAYGLPCIAPPKGGPPELVEHQINGYLIESTDTAIVASYIETLANNQNIWHEMSEASFDRAKKFTFNEFSREILSAVAEV